MAQSYQVDIVTKVVGASSVAKLERSLENLTAEQNKVDRASVKAANGIRTFNSSARAAGTSSKAAASGVQNLGAAINAAAAKITVIVGAVQTFGRVMGATFERQNAEKRLQNLTGSAGEYEAALLAAKAASEKFGITQTEATQALGDVYSRLSGVGYGLKEVTTIYEGFNTVARESGISSEAASSAFLQLGQAMGSGVLQGDELRSILEQMPQLTQLIAQQMGVSTAEIKKLGSEGKITSEIIYSALQKASEGAGDLSGKLTPAQQNMNELRKAVDKASGALGTAWVPAITSLLNAVTPVIEAVGTLIEKLNELGLSKVFNFLMKPAKICGDLIGGATDNTEELSTAAKGTVESYSSLPTPIEKAAADTEKLKTNTEGVVAPLQQTRTELEGIAVSTNGAAASMTNLETSTRATRDAAESVGQELQKYEGILELAVTKTGQIGTATAVAASEMSEAEFHADGMATKLNKMYTTQMDAVNEIQRMQEGIGGAANKAEEYAYAMEQIAKETAATQAAMNSVNVLTDSAASSAGRFANEMERAASASARAAASVGAARGGGGGGGSIKGSSSSVDYSGKIYDKYKLGPDGQIVETTAEDRLRQMNSARIRAANEASRRAQAWDLSTAGMNYSKHASIVMHSGGMTGEKLSKFNLKDKSKRMYAVKEAVFPFNKFPNSDLLLGPEMKSTGEVMGFDKDFGMAFAKSQIAAANSLPKQGLAFVSLKDSHKDEGLDLAKELIKLNFTLCATRGTAEYIQKHGMKCKIINKVSSGSPHIVDVLDSKKIALVINTGGGNSEHRLNDAIALRRATLKNKVPYCTNMSTAQACLEAIKSLKTKKLEVTSLQDI